MSIIFSTIFFCISIYLLTLERIDNLFKRVEDQKHYIKDNIILIWLYVVLIIILSK